MLQFFKSKKTASFLAVEAPAFIVADLIAETFYKFGIFTLEVLCFLATWFIVSLGITYVGKLLKTPGARNSIKLE